MTLEFETADTLREVVGELGKHLKLISDVMTVDVAQRGQSLTVLGDDTAVDRAATLLEDFDSISSTG